MTDYINLEAVLHDQLLVDLRTSLAGTNMSDPPTPLPLPPNLPYPLTITRVLAPSNTHISRGDRLLEYAFTSDTSRRELERRSWTTARKGGQQDDEARENDMVGTWEISIEGEVVRWDQEFRDGYIVERKHAG